MIKRPKPTDTEDDVLQMQNEFLKKQSQTADFQPAAKLVPVESGISKEPNTSGLNWSKVISYFFCDSAKKVSKFAQERAKKSKVSDGENVTSNTNSLQNIIIGNIVERTEGESSKLILDESMSTDDSKGFPKPKRIDQKVFHVTFEFFNQNQW